MATELEFEWDESKAQSNLAKHGIPFEYATRVFLDASAIDFDASSAGDNEVRRKIVGMIEERIFTIVYTKRSRVTRIISARRCNAKEARLYGAV